MARGARCSRFLAVFFVAGETTEAFVDSEGRAVVAGVDLAAGLRGVALVAESLALVGADLDQASAFEHLRERKTGECDVILFATIKQSQRRTANFFARAGVIRLDRRARERCAVTMHLMARQARDCRLIR